MQNKEKQTLQIHSEPKASEKWWALFGIGTGVFMFGLDIHIVTLALPTLVESFHTNFITIQWVAIGYLLMLNVFVLAVGRLGDMYSKKLLYLAGMLLFTLGSLLCGLAPNVSFLIGFRVVQGIGAVFIAALGTAIITEIFPEKQRGQALGIIAGIFAISIALGPTVGGLLINLWDWPLIFWVNVPIGVIASWIVLRVVPKEIITKESQPFDWIGALLMAISLSCFALGITLVQNQGFGSIKVLILFTLAAISLACFLAIESRIQAPLLNLKIFKSLQLSLNLLMNSIVYIALTGVIFIIPFFLELVKHYPASRVGLLMAVQPMLNGLISPICGMLSDRFGERIISLIGLILMTFGYLAIATFNSELTSLGYIVRMIPVGVGMGMFYAPNNSAVMGAVSKEYLGITSALLSLSRTFGHMSGVPILGALFSTFTIATAKLSGFDVKDVTDAPVEALVFGVQATFHTAAIIMAALVIVTSVFWVLEKVEKPVVTTS